MTAADLARLERAVRAYKATQPRDAEVNAAVRRARLSLTRPKRRRSWFSKGLVLVVLAIGSLAYAKPQALGELLERVSPRDGAGKSGRLLTGAASAPAAAALQTAKALRARSKASTPSKLDDGAATADDALEASAAAPPPGAAVSPEASASPAQPRAAEPTAVLAAPTKTEAKPRATTDWGRVGQALARGDNGEALSALSQLAESDDPRTRDKADLGRAQLLMAHGEPEEACALARSLTHRRAGGRIERQAELLLKSCKR